MTNLSNQVFQLYTGVLLRHEWVNSSEISPWRPNPLEESLQILATIFLMWRLNVEAKSPARISILFSQG